jgi:hypothetical protein
VLSRRHARYIVEYSFLGCLAPPFFIIASLFFAHILDDLININSVCLSRSGPCLGHMEGVGYTWLGKVLTSQVRHFRCLHCLPFFFPSSLYFCIRRTMIGINYTCLNRSRPCLSHIEREATSESGTLLFSSNRLARPPWFAFSGSLPPFHLYPLPIFAGHPFPHTSHPHPCAHYSN